MLKNIIILCVVLGLSWYAYTYFYKKKKQTPTTPKVKRQTREVRTNDKIDVEFDKEYVFTMKNSNDQDIFKGPVKTPGRLFAIGDIHGDIVGAIRLLEMMGLVKRGKWVGGNATCVVVGDLMDRGKYTKKLLAWMMNLQGQAKEAGGRLVVLMGNHELMNIIGDYTYVSKEDIDSFGGKENREVALSHKTVVGEWLRTLPVVANINGYCFVHAGITHDVAKLVKDKNVSVLNDIFHADPEKVDINEYMVSMSLKENEGILWDRTMIEYDDESYAKLVHQLGVKGIVIGHTMAYEFGKAKEGCVGVLHGGKLAMIDTGISQGHLNAIEITDQGIVPLFDPVHS